MSKVHSSPPDPITPISIEHGFEDYTGEDIAGPIYNYLVYRFEREGMSTWARVYLPIWESVKIMTMRPPETDAMKTFLADVREYLDRRYESVEYFYEVGK